MNKYPPLVYISAPYRARTPWEIEQNVQLAERIGHFVMINGMSPIVPHLLYRNYVGGAITEQRIIETTREIMRRCDAVYVAGIGWASSRGVIGETEEARRLRIPVFYDMSTGHASSADRAGCRSMIEYFNKQKTFRVSKR